jgi:hypothetical protein
MEAMSETDRTLLALLLCAVFICWLLASLLLERERVRHLLADVGILKAEVGRLRRLGAGGRGTGAVYAGPSVGAAHDEESGQQAYDRLLVEQLSADLGPGWEISVRGEPILKADVLNKGGRNGDRD